MTEYGVSVRFNEPHDEHIARVSLWAYQSKDSGVEYWETNPYTTIEYADIRRVDAASHPYTPEKLEDVIYTTIILYMTKKRTLEDRAKVDSQVFKSLKNRTDKSVKLRWKK